MNVQKFLEELKVAMKDEDERAMLDSAWYSKTFVLSTDDQCTFIGRIDMKFRTYVFIPGGIVPGISYGQAIVLQTADESGFIGDTAPIVFNNEGIWEIAVPIKNPSRISNWGNSVIEAVRGSKNNKAVMHLFQQLTSVKLGIQYADSAVITGWNPQTTQAVGGQIQTNIIILDDKSDINPPPEEDEDLQSSQFTWMTIKDFIEICEDPMTVFALAKAKVKGLLSF